MSIIAVDIGSSFTKFAWPTRSDRGLENFLAVPNTTPLDPPLLEQIRQSLPARARQKSSPNSMGTKILWAISSVNPPRLKELRQEISRSRTDLICEIDHQQVPLVTEVEFPGQLGRDRLIATWRATSLSTHRPLVVIDAGTAVTIDFVDTRGIHVGGLILPGMHVMLNSLGRQTNSLPDLTSTTGREMGQEPAGDGKTEKAGAGSSVELPLDLPLYGINTFQAISCGVLQCQVAVLLSCTGQASQKWGKKPQVFLTGGGIEALRSHLPPDWLCDPHLVLSGVYEIAKIELAKG